MSAPPHISFSQWQSLSRCGYQYKLGRVDQVPTLPGVAGVGGSAVHSWTEEYDRGEFHYDDLRLYAEDVAHHRWELLLSEAVAEEEEKSGFAASEFKPSGRRTKERPNKEDLDVWLFFGWELCQKYVAWAEKTEWAIAFDLPPDHVGNTAGIEYELRTEVNGGEFVAKLDRITRNAKGELGIVDIKTGAQMRRTAQLPIYLAEAKHWGLDVRWVAYYNARKGESTEPKYLPHWKHERVEALFAAQQKTKTDNSYAPTPGEHCAWCGVEPHCMFAV